MTTFEITSKKLTALKKEMRHPLEGDTPMDVYNYAVSVLDKALMDDVVSIGWWKREHAELNRVLIKAEFGEEA